MCGLFGMISELRPSGEPTAENILNLLSHRGPDQSGIYLDNLIWMGHRRLSILDLSENGKQPMSDHSGEIYITVNGEIYNYGEIKKDLISRYGFRSNSDSEVLIYAYREYGLAKMLDKIDGMYAFCLYDKPKQKVYLVRDRAGVKPLFYANHKGRLAWASELKALKALSGNSLELNPEAIYDYLSYLYIPQPKTMYRDVFKLRPGHFLEIDLASGSVKEQAYWKPDIRNIRNIGADEAAEHLCFLVQKSVKEQLMSDVPLGFFLSGGIDSGIVVSEASKINRTNHTFTIGFDDPLHSEIPYARQIASLSNTSHREKILSEDSALELMPGMANWYDEPYADTSAMPSFLVSRFAREHVTVALTGDGGDEVFGGYLWYLKFMKYRNVLPKLPLNRFLSKTKNSFRYQIPGKISNRLLNYNLQPSALYVKLLGGMIREEKLWYRQAWNIPEDYNDYWLFDPVLTNTHAGLKDLQYLDFTCYLPDDILTKMDRVSMAVSLEARVPLLSREIIEFMFSLPEEIVFYGKSLKGLVKHAYRDRLPAEILHRKKRGFNIPVHKWADLYSDTSKNMAEVLLEKVYRVPGLQLPAPK